MGTSTTRPITFRHPSPEDGAAMHTLAQNSPPLDVNSLYAYLLVGRDFSATSIIAEQDGKLLGFISGYIPPKQPDTLFIWQVAVDKSARGKGLASAMLSRLWQHIEDNKVCFCETTITSSNAASQKLFSGFAHAHAAECQSSTAFAAELFGTQAHEEERLFRIGPFSHDTKEKVA